MRPPARLRRSSPIAASTGSCAAETVPSATSAIRTDPPRSRDSATAQTAATASRPPGPSTSGGRSLDDCADEVVELDRDRRRVDLGERQVVLGSRRAEERGRRRRRARSRRARDAARHRSASGRRAARPPAPPERSGGTLIEPSRPCTLRWNHVAAGPGRNVCELDRARRTPTRTVRRASPRRSPA